MMKKLMLIGCLAAGAAEARVVQPASLPTYTYLDTEVSTNVPISMANVAIQGYRVELEFTASASNCVEVAFGTDSNHDGRLDLGEVSFAFGWDCGSWTMCGPAREISRPCGEGIIGTETRLELDIAVRGRRAQRIGASAEGRDFFSQGSEREASPGDGDVPYHDAEPWMFDPGWNLMRITVRGVEGASERLSLETKVNAMRVIVR